MPRAEPVTIAAFPPALPLAPPASSTVESVRLLDHHPDESGSTPSDVTGRTGKPACSARTARISPSCKLCTWLGGQLPQHLLSRSRRRPHCKPRAPFGPSGVSTAGKTRRWFGCAIPHDEALVLQCLDHLAHRLRRHVRATRELRVRELTAPAEHAERRVLQRRQPVRLDALVDHLRAGALQSRDDVAEARFSSGSSAAESAPQNRQRASGHVPSCQVTCDFRTMNLARILSTKARPCTATSRPLVSRAPPSPTPTSTARQRSPALALRERGVGRRRPSRDHATELAGVRRRLFGALRVGAVAVPLNVRCSHRRRSISALAARRRSSSSKTSCPPSARPSARWQSADAADAAVILFTSGTSGRPKGAILTHGGILRRPGTRPTAMALAPMTSCSARRPSPTCSASRPASFRRCSQEGRLRSSSASTQSRRWRR